jgi:hypothetical protein
MCMKEIDPYLPVNKIAAFVVSKSEEKGVKLNIGDQLFSSTPLPTTAFTGRPEHDLTGRKCGRFTVMGCAVYRAPGRVNTVRWVVKCTCGNYQIMTSKAVKRNKDNPEMACLACQQTRHLRFRHNNGL